MISGAYLHSTLSNFTQIWEAHDETTSAYYNRLKRIAFGVYNIKKAFETTPLVAQK